jgi:hypothetical protein
MDRIFHELGINLDLMDQVEDPQCDSVILVHIKPRVHVVLMLTR